jgi:hypothetical protein
MKKTLAIVLATVLLAGCGGNNAPDVSHVPVALKTARFEEDFFHLDTNNIRASLADLKRKQPLFADDFTENVLGAGRVADTNQVLPGAALAFYRSYLPVYDTLKQAYKDFAPIEHDLVDALRHVRYYFPNYRLPDQLVTFIGPFDAPGVAITQHAIAVGLQLFAGKNFSFYNSQQGQELYPAYISRRFDKAFIVPDCMKAISEDLYADKSGGKSLVEQMVEKGRYWYMLDRFLPATDDSLKTGYTATQLKWTQANEGLLWNFFLENNLLYNTDPSQVQLYIGDAPNTQGFGDNSPGNIGQWVGWQIVKAYMKKNPSVTLPQLMTMDSKQIFQESKYKPR